MLGRWSDSRRSAFRRSTLTLLTHTGRDGAHESATDRRAGQARGEDDPPGRPEFKIGRGETCHLRPNSEQVSREHAEFVARRRTRSRSATSAAATARSSTARRSTEPCTLKDRDLVQVGPLTFAVSIEGVPAAAKAAVAAAARPKAAARRRQPRRHRVLAGRRQQEPRPRAPLGRLRRRHDHDRRVQGREAPTPKPAARPRADARRPGARTAPTTSDEEYERLPEGDGRHRGVRGRRTTTTEDDAATEDDARGVRRRVEPVLRQEEGAPSRPARPSPPTRTRATPPATSSAR